jgi:hypothetical protein
MFVPPPVTLSRQCADKLNRARRTKGIESVSRLLTVLSGALAPRM